ncbi:hypothetical protein [Streptomyces sp. NPDC048442]|uniref:hypothetical protein n=1 Tax=Streptomyces sp. NPDC048442 TaxID=3154823 RepID=UPI0034397542
MAEESPVPPLPQDYLLALGTMVTTAAIVEFRLRVISTQLLDSRYSGLITAGETVGKLLDLCEQITKQQQLVGGGRVPELLPLLSRCRAAFKRRDQYIHGTITWGPDEAEWTTMRSRRWKPLPEFGPAAAEDLVDLSKELNTVCDGLIACSLKIH